MVGSLFNVPQKLLNQGFAAESTTDSTSGAAIPGFFVAAQPLYGNANPD
jgi:hypothetical protein